MTSAPDVRPAPSPAREGGGRYMEQLDALRALAVLGVVVFHYVPQAQQTPLGEMGVRLFFVLSGFLITRILLQCRNLVDEGQSRWFTLRQFYARRFLRIFPVYYFALAATYILGIPEIREGIYWHLTYTSNFHDCLSGQLTGPASHLWSLSVEEQFYLVWPWLILLVPKRVIAPLMMATLLFGPAYRAVIVGTGASPVWAFRPPMACMDTLGAGALLAWLWSSAQTPAGARRLARVRGGFAIAGSLLLAWYLVGWFTRRWEPARHILGDTAMALAFFAVIDRTARGFEGPIGRFLQINVLLYIGKISYGIYLFHNLIPALLPGAFARVGLGTIYPSDQGATLWIQVTKFIIKVAAFFVVAMVSWHFFEKPLNELKRFFPYRRAPRQGAIGGPPAGAAQSDA